MFNDALKQVSKLAAKKGTIYLLPPSVKRVKSFAKKRCVAALPMLIIVG